MMIRWIDELHPYKLAYLLNQDFTKNEQKTNKTEKSLKYYTCVYIYIKLKLPP